MHAQQPAYLVAGKVVDPVTGEGIPGAYVAFQGQYVELFFGGPEYFDDLAIDSTNSNGQFALHIPTAVVDSFLKEHGQFFPNFRFALNVRTERELNASEMYFGYNVLIRMLPIGNDTRYNDRNYINHRTLILTPKNKKWKSDTTGMVIPFSKGGVIHFVMPKEDTAFMNNNTLHVFVQELDKKNGKPIIEDQTNFDLSDRKPTNNLLVKSHTIMNITLCKWPRHENNMDTLTTIKNIELQPGEVRNIPVRPAIKK
jgi:hypothetical protein